MCGCFRYCALMGRFVVVWLIAVSWLAGYLVLCAGVGLLVVGCGCLCMWLFTGA